MAMANANKYILLIGKSAPYMGIRIGLHAYLLSSFIGVGFRPVHFEPGGLIRAGRTIYPTGKLFSRQPAGSTVAMPVRHQSRKA